MNFIELTNTDGTKFIGNTSLLQRVFIDMYGKTRVVGWSNSPSHNGSIVVMETYEEVIRKIDAQLAGVNRF
jgi:hypothetical protein